MDFYRKCYAYFKNYITYSYNNIAFLNYLIQFNNQLNISVKFMKIFYEILHKTI